MALIQGGARANGTAEVVDGHLQVSQEHTPFNFVPVQFIAINFATTVAEGLVSLQAYRDYAVSGAPATSFAPTTGKKLKITSAGFTVRNAAAVQQNALLSIRVNTAGVAAVATLPVVSVLSATAPGAVAGQSAEVDRTYGDHLILATDDQFAVSQMGTAAAGNYLLIRGYEYTE